MSKRERKKKQRRRKKDKDTAVLSPVETFVAAFSDDGPVWGVLEELLEDDSAVVMLKDNSVYVRTTGIADALKSYQMTYREFKKVISNKLTYVPQSDELDRFIGHSQVVPMHGRFDDKETVEKMVGIPNILEVIQNGTRQPIAVQIGRGGEVQLPNI